MKKIRQEYDAEIVDRFTKQVIPFTHLSGHFDPIQKVIHIRLASRVGYGDMGVNKKRAELFKKLYNKKAQEAKQSLHATPKNAAH